ncbi:MAG TPA: DUF6599 family protein [Candidatus Sulfomarinibacteraceae bacterium]|nr:DUF6599 family protein [Candidatus Sulfomarinibacteraceae bacterium]
MGLRTSARLVALAAATMLGCGGPPPPSGAPSELAAILPPATELQGWTIAEGPVRHSPDSLYEYVNGGADRYLANGFRELVHVRYQRGEDPTACVTLDVYDMGSELGAFGIFSAARRPELEARAWGSGGYRTGTVAAAWKGAVFVHAEADDQRTELVELMERLVAGVCDRAPGEPTNPAVLDPLPVGGRVARSERYVPADLLGHAFLPGGVLAAYEVDGKRGELYVSDLGSDTVATDAFKRLRAHLERWGSVDPGPPPLAVEAFSYRDPTAGEGTAVRVGGVIAGIHGELSRADRERVLRELLDALL